MIWVSTKTGEDWNRTKQSQVENYQVTARNTLCADDESGQESSKTMVTTIENQMITNRLAVNATNTQVMCLIQSRRELRWSRRRVYKRSNLVRRMVLMDSLHKMLRFRNSVCFYQLLRHIAEDNFNRDDEIILNNFLILWCRELKLRA
jgi:hypothetical protein